MRTRTLCAVVLIVVGLSLSLLVACSERRSTGPEQQPAIPAATTKLPALSVYDNPIIALSDTIWGGRETSDLFEIGYGINLQQPDDPAFDRVSDIVLGYWSAFLCASLHLSDPRSPNWVQIDAPWDNQPCSPLRERDLRSVWHLSEAAISLDEIMQYGGGRLHLGGSGFERVNAQLVRYHDDYRCIRLGRNLPGYEPWIEVGALTWGGGKIWVAVHCKKVEAGVRHTADSIWAFDSIGTRVVAFGHDTGEVWGLEYRDGELWTLGTGIPSLVVFDEDGIPTRSLPCRLYPGDMTLAMDRLWIPGGPERVLHGFVLDSAFWEGEPRSDWTFTLPEEMDYRYCYNWLGQYYYNCAGVAWDGSYFYLGTPSSVAKVNLSSQLVAEYELPVTKPWMLAWDGEAVWVVHNGPPGTESATLWLSRFYLP